MSNQITWGYMKEWAIANHVPDDAIVIDFDTAEEAADISFSPKDGIDPAFFEIEFYSVGMSQNE